MRIVVSPDGDDLALDMFGYLQNWQIDFSPKPWQRLWLKLRWWVTPFIFIWIIAGLQILTESARINPMDTLKNEARNLLRHGENYSNQLEVERLLLAIASDYVPDGQKAENRISPRGWTYFALGIVVLIVIRICPKRAIGIWADRQKLIRERLWTKLIFRSIPALIITGILLPRLYH